MTTYTLSIIVEGQDHASGPLGAASGALGRIGEIAAGILSANVITNLANQVWSGVTAFASYGLEAVLAGSRVNELALVNNVLAENAGLSAAAVQDQVAAVRAMGIEAAISQGIVASMIRANLDWTEAANIARIAQDSAVIAGINSSEATAQIIHGITTMNPLILRNAGLIVDSQQAYEEYAESIGKAASQLTAAEKQQAFLNATIKAGENIAGAYSAAMNDPGKVLRSFPRYLDDIKIAFGQPFQKAFATAIFAAADWTKALGKALQEGGALYPVLQRLGLGVEGIADKFAAWINNIKPDEFFAALGKKAEYFLDVLDRIKAFGFDKVIKPYVWQNLLGINPVTWKFISDQLRAAIGAVFAGIGVGGTGIFAGITAATLAGPFMPAIAGLPAVLGSSLSAAATSIGGALFTGLLLTLSRFSPLLGGAFFRMFMTGGIAEGIGAAFLALGGKVGGFFKFLLPLAPLMGGILGFFALGVVALTAFGVVMKALSGDTAFFVGIGEKLQSGLNKIGNFWLEQGPKIAEIGAQVWNALSEAGTQLAEKVLPWLGEQFEKFGQWFEDNGPLITETIAVLADFFTNNLLPAIVGFWDVVEPILTALLDGIGGIATAIMQAITGDWEAAGATLVGVFEGLWEGIKGTFMAFVDWVLSWIGTDWATVSATWTQNWEMLKQIVSLVWQHIATTVTTFAGTVISTILQFVANIQSGIQAGMTAIQMMWTSSWAAITASVATTAAAIVAGIIGMIASVAAAVSGGGAALYSAGQNMLGGLLEGITKKGAEILAYVKQLAADIAKTFANVLQIQSPSRIFIQFGEHIISGLARGIQRSGQAVSAIDQQARAIMSPFSSSSTTAYNYGGPVSIVIDGARDPEAVAQEIYNLLKAQGVVAA